VLPVDRSSERELAEVIARLDAELAILGRVDSLSERARADLAAKRARRDELVAALAALRS
jgi:hypothetical protein